MIKEKQILNGVKPYSTPKYAKIWDLKLDSNENPYGASKEVLWALKELNGTRISRYPHYGELIDKVAQRFKVLPDEILVTNGADEALSVVINTFLDKDEELLCFMPTFSMPLIYAQSAGAKIKHVDYYTKWLFDADKLIEQVDDKTKMIYISSPNNPTGECASRADIEKILSKFPNVGLILDITYINFSHNPDEYYSLVRDYDNIFIVKSFSKDLGLAGLRLGAIASRKQNILSCKKIISPFSVNIAAVCAGIASLNDVEYENFIKEQTKASRDALYEGFGEMGFKPCKSEANFILCDFGKYCDFVFQKLISKGIITKNFQKGSILETYLRITTPKAQDVAKIFDALKKKDVIVLDLDGVVFDVSNSYRLAIKETFKHFAKKDISDREIQEAKDSGGLNCDWDLTKHLLDKYGVNVSLDEITEVFQQIFFNPDKAGSKGLIDNEKLLIEPCVFEKLSEKYDFCVFTGRPYNEAVYSLEKFGILKYFSKIVSQDDLDKETRKPHPGGLNKIKREIIFNKICYFGDTIDDIYSGVASSTLTYGVAEKDSRSAKILLEAGAREIIYDISKLDEFLELKEKTHANS